MQKIVVGNWKMHGDIAAAESLAMFVAEQSQSLPAHVKVIVCPPTTILGKVAAKLAGSSVKIGGQDCHAQPEGAFTGDTSASMLKAAGCSHVIVGHSERRRYHHESNNDIRQKAARAIKTGLTPIICVGESEAERDAGQARDVVGAQVAECIPEEALSGNFILAYEPVWAIGSGKTPSVDDIRLMHTYIVSAAVKRTGLAEAQIHVLYGGSVKPDNAHQIMIAEGVAGVLVGGASLKADEFGRIMAAA